MDLNTVIHDDGIYTFIADETVKIGTLVTFISNCAVTACQKGERIAGLCLNARDGYAAIKISGLVQVNTVEKIEVGHRKLAAASDTEVALDDNGIEYLVISSDDNTASILL